MMDSKVVSVRMPLSLIHKLDELSNSNPYWSRNRIIIRILLVVLECADLGTIWSIIRFYRLNTGKAKIMFEKENL